MGSSGVLFHLKVSEGEHKGVSYCFIDGESLGLENLCDLPKDIASERNFYSQPALTLRADFLPRQSRSIV